MVLQHLTCFLIFANMNLQPLSNLLKGDSAIINKIKDSSLSLKLMEMGCIPGERVRVDAISPFGDPIAIRVSDYTLSLRLSDAKNIFVVNE